MVHPEKIVFSGKIHYLLCMYMYMNALDQAILDDNWVTCDSVVFIFQDFKITWKTSYA